MSSSDITNLIGLSAIISGGVSAFINYVMNFRGFKKRNNILQLEQKIALYSYLIFQLDRMRFTWKSLEDLGKIHKQENPEQQHYVYSSSEREQMFRDMTKRIEQDYHLFRQDLMRLWINISELFTNPSIEGKVPELNRLLVEEHNKIIKEYKKVSGNKLEPRT